MQEETRGESAVVRRGRNARRRLEGHRLHRVLAHLRW